MCLLQEEVLSQACDGEYPSRRNATGELWAEPGQMLEEAPSQSACGSILQPPTYLHVHLTAISPAQNQGKFCCDAPVGWGCAPWWSLVILEHHCAHTSTFFQTLGQHLTRTAESSTPSSSEYSCGTFISWMVLGLKADSSWAPLKINSDVFHCKNVPKYCNKIPWFFTEVVCTLKCSNKSLMCFKIISISSTGVTELLRPVKSNLPVTSAVPRPEALHRFTWVSLSKLY